MVCEQNKWKDDRGNYWTKKTFEKSDQHFLNTIRKNWETVSDDDILAAKKIVLNIYSDNYNIRGHPCFDFIYMFNDSNHYFVSTDINKEPTILKYEAECDMHLNPNTSFDELSMFI